MLINPNQTFDPWTGALSGMPMAGVDSAALSRLGGLDGMNPAAGIGGPAAGGADGILSMILGLLSGLMRGGGGAANNGANNGGASPSTLGGSNGGGGGASPSTDTSGSSSSSNAGGTTSTSVGNLPPGLAPHAKDFEDAGRQYGIDPKFLAAISMVETGDGTSSAFRNKKNAMGISSSSGPTAQNSVRESIFKMARTLSNPNGPYKGKKTIDAIGAVYAPVGASNDPNGTNGGWPAMVKKKLAQLGGNPNQIFTGTGNSNTMYA